MEKAIFRMLCMSFLLTSSVLFSQTGYNYNGQVYYHENYPLSNANAYLHSSDGTVIDSAVSDYQGYFEFENVAPGTYNISFSTGEPAGGVDLADAFLVLMKIFNIVDLDEIQTLAADVNGSGIIDWSDYITILVGYLNQGDPFPLGPWVFINEPITIPSPSREGDLKLGSSSGDVNGSLQPDPKSNPIFLNDPLIDLIKESNQTLDFNLYCEQNLQISGMHLAFKIPSGLNKLSVESPLTGAIITIKDEMIKITWLDQDRKGIEINKGMTLVTIHAKETNTAFSKNIYRLKLADESHFIDFAGNSIPSVNLTLPALNVENRPEFIHSAYPNPFNSQFTLNYQLPSDGAVSIRLFDQYGRMVREIESGSRSAGIHQEKIDGSALTCGIYQYSIHFGSDAQLKHSGTIIKSK